jgi:hypothetical protein
MAIPEFGTKPTAIIRLVADPAVAVDRCLGRSSPGAPVGSATRDRRSPPANGTRSPPRLGSPASRPAGCRRTSWPPSSASPPGRRRSRSTTMTCSMRRGNRGVLGAVGSRRARRSRGGGPRGPAGRPGDEPGRAQLPDLVVALGQASRPAGSLALGLPDTAAVRGRGQETSGHRSLRPGSSPTARPGRSRSSRPAWWRISPVPGRWCCDDEAGYPPSGLLRRHVPGGGRSVAIRGPLVRAAQIRD